MLAIHSFFVCIQIYDTLNIKGLEERGESFYNPFLNDVVEELEEKGLAVESEGATAVFLDGVSCVTNIVGQKVFCVCSLY